MQNPNEDTEWNDVLRAKGIIPQKEKEITEDEIVDLLEKTVAKKTGNVVKNYEDMTLDELDEFEDEEDERVLAQYKSQRLSEMKAFQKTAVYGDVREISAQDYVQEVNNAGEGIWVILHLFQSGYSSLLFNQPVSNKPCKKIPSYKILKSVSTVCIPNYPDKNLPTLFVYCNGEMKGQLIGPLTFGGMNLKEEELEWMLSATGAVKTDLEEDPRKKNEVKDVMEASLRYIDPDDSDEDD